MARQAGVAGRQLGRAVVRPVMVVPRLRKMAVGVLGDARVEWKRECEQDAVFVGVERRSEAGLGAGVAHALEAAVGGRVRSPARHSRDVELAVLGVEPSAVHAREKFAGQGDDRTLGLAVDFLAKDQEMRARPEAEVQKLPFERPESAVRDGHLAAARIVEPARKVDQWQVGSLAVLGTAVAIVAARAGLRRSSTRASIRLPSSGR